MAVVVVTPPSVEPVSLALAKQHLRLDADTTDQDLLVQLLISAAREKAESELGRALITQTLKARAPLQLTPPPAMPFQYQAQPGVLFQQPGQMPVAQIQIPRVSRETLGNITSVSLIAPDSTESALDSSQYFLNFTQLQPRLMLNNPARVYDCEVVYQAGYGDTEDKIPAGIRRWLLFYINTLFENREAVVIGMTVNPLPTSFIDGLLDPYRLPVSV